MQKQATTEQPRNYRLHWNGKPQPLGANTFESVKRYIKTSLAHGGCYLWQFEIFDDWGQLKTNIIYDTKANPTALTSYFKLN